MKKLLTFLFWLVGTIHAQGFVAGGYIYNVREDDHGAWVELGANYHRFGGTVDFSKMISDPFLYREAQFLGRYRFVTNLSVEAGWIEGAACFAPEIPNSCQYHDTKRTHTPLVGLLWAAPPRGKRPQPVVRMDFTRWQQPPTMLKDDGFRIMFGVRWPGVK